MVYMLKLPSSFVKIKNLIQCPDISSVQISAVFRPTCTSQRAKNGILCDTVGYYSDTIGYTEDKNALKEGERWSF